MGIARRQGLSVTPAVSSDTEKTRKQENNINSKNNNVNTPPLTILTQIQIQIKVIVVMATISEAPIAPEAVPQKHIHRTAPVAAAP